MNHLVKSLALSVLFILILNSCRKDDDNMGPITVKDIALFEASLLLNEVQGRFVEKTNDLNGNAKKALMEVQVWLDTQEKTSTSELVDDSYLYFTTTDGIQMVYNYFESDDDGVPLYRGGSTGGKMSRFSRLSNGECSNEIENKKVLIYVVVEEWYSENSINDILQIFEDSEISFDVEILRGPQCTPEKLEEFKNYGLVILNTHGFPNGYLSGINFRFDVPSISDNVVEIFRSSLIEQIGQSSYDLLLAGKVRASKFNFLGSDNTFYSGNSEINLFHLWVHSNYIKSNVELKNTIVFGNMCSSGENRRSDGIRGAFMSKDPISYYAYNIADDRATLVSNKFAKEMEKVLLNALIIDGDSTGNAHFKNDLTADLYQDTECNISLICNFLKHYNKENFCYQQNCVPLIDDRDGEEYKTVCIGGQTWMAQNLRYNAPGSFCLYNEESNCDKFGRLYNYEALLNGENQSDGVPSGVQGLCPKGWHIPSDDEWKILEKNLGMAESDLKLSGSPRGEDQLVGVKLKSDIFWDENVSQPARNESEFSSLGGGYYFLPSGESGDPNDATCRYDYLLESVGYYTSSALPNAAFNSVMVRTIWRNDVSTGVFRNGQAVGEIMDHVGGQCEATRMYCRCVKD